MATDTSAIILAKGALYDLLEANMDVEITWGDPGKNMKKEHVIVGDVRGGQVADKLGDVTRQEEFEIEVLVRVAQMRGNQRTVSTRASVIAAEVETLIRDNRELTIESGRLHFAGITEEGLGEAFGGDKGRVAVWRMSVGVIGKLRRVP